MKAEVSRFMENPLAPFNRKEQVLNSITGNQSRDTEIMIVVPVHLLLLLCDP